MRILVDVGAHYGETLHVALDPQWGFDRIYSLEPATACQALLHKFRDRRIIILPIALSNRNGEATLHGAGDLGGSLYADKKQPADRPERKETIELVAASKWFRDTISPDAQIFLKMNCEGGEADILDDLLDSGEIARVHSIYVDFDIRKVPSQAHRHEALERRLKDSGVRYLSTSETKLDGNAGVEAWLERDCPKVQAPISRRLAHRFRIYAPVYVQATMLIRHLMPRRMYYWLGRRFGRLARRRSGAASL